MSTTFAWNSAPFAAGVNLWGFWFASASKWKANIAPAYIAGLNDGYHEEFVADATQIQQVVFANASQSFLVSVDGGAAQTVTAGVTGSQTLTWATGLSAGPHLIRVHTNGTGETLGDLILTGSTETLVSQAKAQAFFNKSALVGNPASPAGVPTSPFAFWGAHKVFSNPAHIINTSEYNSCLVEGRFTGGGVEILAFYDSNMHVINGIDTVGVDKLFAPGGLSGNYGWNTLAAGLANATHRFREYIYGGASGNGFWAAMRCTNAQAIQGSVSIGATSITLKATVPAGWANNHWVYVGYEGNTGHGEVAQIASIVGSTVNFVNPLANTHADGDPIWSYCDSVTGSFLATDETIGTTSDPSDLTRIYHPPNGAIVNVGDSLFQEMSADLNGDPGPNGGPAYIQYDDRFSCARRYAQANGYDLINLAHQGDATANVVARDADFSVFNTTGCEQWLLLIGTNDANTNVLTSDYGTRLGTIIDAFVAASPVNSVILLSHIFSPTNKDITGYNAQIDAVAAAKQTQYPNYLIRVADFASSASLILNTNPGGDMFDTLHLNNQGAGKVAAVMPGLFASAIPGTPLNLHAATGQVQITLTWSAVNLATSYKVRRDGVVVFTGNALTYTDSVAGGSLHTYTVSAFNGVGESPVSAAQSIVANVGSGSGGISLVSPNTAEQFEVTTYSVTTPGSLGLAAAYVGDSLALYFKLYDPKATLMFSPVPTFQLFDAATSEPVIGFETPVNVSGYDTTPAKIMQGYYLLSLSGVAPGAYEGIFAVTGQTSNGTPFSVRAVIRLTVSSVPGG